MASKEERIEEVQAALMALLRKHEGQLALVDALKAYERRNGSLPLRVLRGSHGRDDD